MRTASEKPRKRAAASSIRTAARSVRTKGIRFLVVGALNTAFAYAVATTLYYVLTPRLHIVAIGAIANVVCITESFVAYKLFVFRSQGHWLREYLRCYVVYGGNALIGISGLWLLVDVVGIAFWVAQGLLMIVGIAVSYAGHDRFTFDKAQRE